MNVVRRELWSAALVLGLGGCIAAGMMRNASESSTTSLTSAQIQASTAAPCLPILVLRTARDDLELGDGDRANIAMIVSVAELDARTLARSRAALLEGLARGVEAGKLDDVLIGLLTDQMPWAANDVAPRLQRDMDQLYDVLSSDQRRAVVARVRPKLPNWSQTWAADSTPRWLDAWAEGTMGEGELAGELTNTSKKWAEKSVGNVRGALPRLDASQKRALAASLRTGVPE